MNIFVQDLIQNNKILAWFIIWYFRDNHAVLTLSEGSSCTVISAL